MSVVCKNACKAIKGNLILSDVCFSANTGEIVGIMGRNGSGKSMLLKSICGLIKLDRGTIYINNIQLDLMEHMDEVGALIEHPSLIPDMNGLDTLLTLAYIKKRTTKNKIIELMKNFDLDPQNKTRCRSLSLGMRQKLGIIAATMEHPRILLLDEPFNNLDELSAFKVRELLLQLYKQLNTTIIIAGHDRKELTNLCSKLFMMNNGTLEECAL